MATDLKKKAIECPLVYSKKHTQHSLPPTQRLSFDENVRAKEGGKEKDKETIRTLFLF